MYAAGRVGEVGMFLRATQILHEVDPVDPGPSIFHRGTGDREPGRAAELHHGAGGPGSMIPVQRPLGSPVLGYPLGGY